MSYANPPVLDDTYYTFTESGVLGSAVFPRFFTSRIAINIPLTSTTADTAVKSISYNTAGTVLIVGNTSGVVYWSSNFGTSSQSFNPVNTGVVKFNQASIGNGVAIAGGRMTPTNDNLLYAGNISPGNINGGSMAPIDNRGTYYNGTQTVIGTVPGIQGFTAGVGDNVFLTIGTDGNVYLQQQGVSLVYYEMESTTRKSIKYKFRSNCRYCTTIHPCRRNHFIFKYYFHGFYTTRKWSRNSTRRYRCRSRFVKYGSI